MEIRIVINDNDLTIIEDHRTLLKLNKKYFSIEVARFLLNNKLLVYDSIKKVTLKELVTSFIKAHIKIYIVSVLLRKDPKSIVGFDDSFDDFVDEVFKTALEKVREVDKNYYKQLLLLCLKEHKRTK